MLKTTQKKDWLLPIAIGLVIGLGYFLYLSISDMTLQRKRLPNPSGYADIIEPILPFTVSILTNKQINRNQHALSNDPAFEKYFHAEQSTQTSLGSGIVINQQGDVVTNVHVIQDADNIIVLTADKQPVKVTKVLLDPATDIALLKTKLTLNQDLPTNQAPNIRTGDLVFTIGNPFGIGQSVSMGIISATGRQQPGLTKLTDFIQTDAAINPGNSGGALVNTEGQVIGMNTAIFSSTGGYQGIGFAIPMTQVLMVAKQLSEQGEISRGYLGIDVSSTLARPGDQLAGLRIVSVQAGSPAEKAGLKIGDIVTTIDGHVVTSRIQAVRFISQLMPGKQIDIIFVREGLTDSVTITLGLR